jgi:very-short-patch-repair endonuclease/predicted transcriptional regulator of viral defense system
MHVPMSPAHRVAALAEDHQGLVTRQQLLQAGVTPRSVDGLLRRRWLRPIVRGVYLVGAAPTPWLRERAVLLANPVAVLSHWSAAVLRALVPADGDARVVCVLLSRESSARIPGVRAVRTRRLHATEWGLVLGLRVTTPARTLLDLAVELGRRGDTRRLEQLVARALDEKLCTESDVAAVVRRHPRARGAGLLRLVLGDGHPPALSRSEAEERLRQQLVAGGLPVWRQNARVAGHEVDFLWAQQRLVVEVDGYAWHSSRNRFAGDRARDAALTAAGYVVLRFTWQQVDRTPMGVVARIAHVLGMRSVG